jgi:transcription initiation factor TFIID subunit 1
MNVGMASRRITYWHKAAPEDRPRDNLENLHILEPDQTAPFIAQTRRNEPLPSINCRLYSVPVSEHAVRGTDFLLAKAIRRPEFFIRRFNAIDCAGFIEPCQVVLRPSTKTAQDFHMDFIKAVLVNIFRDTEQHPGRWRIQVAQV